MLSSIFSSCKDRFCDASNLKKSAAPFKSIFSCCNSHICWWYTRN
jgi:hypothetical protein